MLNNKGFTLIEVLATLVILGVILAIAVPMGTNAYESSKNKTEKIFVDKLARLVDDYITLNVSDFELDSTAIGEVKKCDLGDFDEEECKNPIPVYKVKTIVKFQDIIDEKLIVENEFINPKGKTACDKDQEIEIYQDKDKVNYFRFKLACISFDNKDANGYAYDNATFFS